MSKSASFPTMREFFSGLYGEEFKGFVSLWEKEQKQTQFFRDNQIEEYLDSAQKLAQSKNVYFNISSQEGDVGPNKRGKIDTVSSLFAFASDIDISGKNENEKDYPPSQKVALEILEKFPYQPTYIHQSGPEGGLHVLWFLNVPMICNNRAERRRAQAMSKAFQRKLLAHFKHHGYEIDSVGDIMRLIRVPHSFNHKTNPPQRVIPLFFNPETKLDVESLDLEEGSDRKREASTKAENTAEHHKICQGCGWYHHQTGIGSSSSSEPDWYAALSITGLCQNGEEIAHDYSSQHPKYDQNETQEKLERALNEAGPRTCKVIEQDLSGEPYCSKCFNYGLVKSPIQLGHGYDPGRIGPIPVGYLSDGRFVLRDQVRDILVTRSSSQLLNYQSLLGLAPSTFWRIQYPNKKGGGVAVSQAGEDLIQACNQAGPFDARAVRGVGLWREGELIVENLGEPVPEEAKEVYLCFSPLPVAATTEYLDVGEISEFLELFPWKNQQDATLFLGWLMIAAMCGALEWRPHIFLYGPANSGKTTLHNAASRLLHPLAINADGQSSAAGIRQSLGPDARPVLIDEFETDQNQNKLAAVTKLARSASSAESRVLMGTPEGKAMEFAIKSTFLFSAINVNGKSPADETRIANLELTHHDNDPEVGRRISAIIRNIQTLGPTWCRFVADHAKHVLETIEVLKLEMPPLDSRHIQNMATLLAGAYVALNQAVPSAQQARNFIQMHKAAIHRHALAHERDDAMECWEYLIAHRIRDRDGEQTLGHWMAIARDNHADKSIKNKMTPAQEIMALYNIRIITSGSHPGIMIANGSPAIDKIFAETKWSRGAWKRALGQIPTVFAPPNPIRVPGMSKKVRCVGVPLELIPKQFSYPDDHKKY